MPASCRRRRDDVAQWLSCAADTEQLGSRGRPIGAPAPGATRLCRLGQRQRRRLAGPLEVRRDTRRREPQPRPRPGAEPHGAELSGVLVDPGAGPSEQPCDLDGVDQRLDPLGHQAAQPGREPIDEQVGEPVERSVVVLPWRSGGGRRGAKWGRRRRCQDVPTRPWRACSVNGAFDPATHISVIWTGTWVRYIIGRKAPRYVGRQTGSRQLGRAAEPSDRGATMTACSRPRRGPVELRAPPAVPAAVARRHGWNRERRDRAAGAGGRERGGGLRRGRPARARGGAWALRPPLAVARRPQPDRRSLRRRGSACARAASCGGVAAAALAPVARPGGHRLAGHRADRCRVRGRDEDEGVRRSPPCAGARTGGVAVAPASAVVPARCLPLVCLVRARGVERVDQNVLVVSIDRLLPALRGCAGRPVADELGIRRASRPPRAFA